MQNINYIKILNAQ